ncbi:SNARE-interacting protein KEULE-like isoform X1 [Camellia sinensis]|uniref:SNARE-interacting protein KEULE-like isoform X1 n=2 Tax=Camellia sinensis TaxID=4442 RepID=UPI0010359BD2|nr:SNARE-interacting protein KEULE-like isoform X1 [Camellia sinensis]XP_028114012.1 SNARE-interacting protein KEULE-like isoform X1 [Camellia sinensis]
MSKSDSDSSSHGTEYKNFRQITRERLLYEMLRSTKTGDSKSTWKVLIMDKVTIKILSYSCKMADVTEEGVSLVEDIYRRRQPLPTMDAIYFIQPTKENVNMFLSDMTGRAALYKKAFIFFSSPVPRELVNHIKKDGSVLPRIGALREMNLEYFAIDSQGFITDNVMALEDLFGDEESTRKGDACLNMMATRIATAFASLREFPLVRYHAAKSLDPTTMTTFRDLIPTKLAAGVWNCLMKYKADLPNFPQTETCELLIVDRSVDQIAPVIHEWTYDAMCHDLLNMDGNKYVHEIPGKAGGVPEKKEVLLEDHDPIWLELRHAHIADASERLHEKMISFVSRNKAAQIHHGSRDGGEISTRDLQKMVQALPQYSEQIDKLSLHVDIAGKINNIVKEMGLKELGQLEQDLVFGDAGTKDVINFLRTNQDVTRENKLRLLMIYAACYPEKFEDDKITKLMELARLPPEDMNAVNNMRLLEGSSDTKKSSTGAFSLKFDVHKNKHAARKDRTGEQVMWQLSRFYPMVEELIEKLSKGELPKDDYPCMNDPSPTFHGTSRTASVQTNQAPAPHSMRQRRATWARPRDSEDGYSSDSILRHASSDFKKMGQRIFVFIVGGATRSELRVCHKLTAKLNREVVLGSSSLDDPPQFITNSVRRRILFLQIRRVKRISNHIN